MLDDCTPLIVYHCFRRNRQMPLNWRLCHRCPIGSVWILELALATWSWTLAAAHVVTSLVLRWVILWCSVVSGLLIITILAVAHVGWGAALGLIIATVVLLLE